MPRTEDGYSLGLRLLRVRNIVIVTVLVLAALVGLGWALFG